MKRFDKLNKCCFYSTESLSVQRKLSGFKVILNITFLLLLNSKLITFIPQRLIKFTTNHPSLNGNKHLSDKDLAFPTYNMLNIFKNLIKKSI